jgi:biotin synthase-like enzyme
MNAVAVRHDWTVDEVLQLLELPLLELLDRARRVHRAFHDPTKVQLATLANIKPAVAAAKSSPAASNQSNAPQNAGM